MKKWNQTTVTWPMWNSHIHGYDEPVEGKTTLVPANEGFYFHCTQLVAEAQHDHRAKFTIVLWEVKNGKWKSKPSAVGLAAAVKRLEPLIQMFPYNKAFVEDSNFDLTVSVPLQPGEPFSEKAVELAGKIFELLGIEDPKKDILGNFTITLTTKVRFEGTWQRYDEWIRNKLGLQKPYVYYWSN